MKIEKDLDQSSIITVNGTPFIKHNDGSLIKLNSEDYDDSNLIYRWVHY